MLTVDARDKAKLIDPLYRAGANFWRVCLALAAVVAWGGYVYAQQFVNGLGETGMNRPNYWGIYIVNFIFLIGVSMAGTLISAALQLTGVEWRRPITRVAETLTVFGLIVAGLQILFDMGRPERMLSMIPFGRLQSPLLWDATSLSLYILTSMLALYIQVLPDIAILRDNLPRKAPEWRRLLYTTLALGWRGNAAQWLRLERSISFISVIIIPIGVSLHTVTSWLFSTTVQPGWKSTILGPYFVIGAIFSGIGLLFLVMTLVRRFMNLEEYFTLKQYRNLGWIFIIMNIVWFYFTYTEHLTLVAEQETNEFPLLAAKLWGEFGPAWWGMVTLMIIAFWVLVIPKLLPAAVERRLEAFRPAGSLTSAVGAAVLLAAIFQPQLFPVRLGLESVVTRTWAWVALGVLLLGTGLGISPWLKRHLVLTSSIAGACVVIGMWLERWLIIVPVMTHPRLIPYTTYVPTLTELSLTAATAALLALMTIVFFKLFPVISLWEIAEGRVIEEATRNVVIPPPQAIVVKRLRQWRLWR